MLIRESLTGLLSSLHRGVPIQVLLRHSSRHSVLRRAADISSRQRWRWISTRGAHSGLSCRHRFYPWRRLSMLHSRSSRRPWSRLDFGPPKGCGRPLNWKIALLGWNGKLSLLGRRLCLARRRLLRWRLLRRRLLEWRRRKRGKRWIQCEIILPRWQLRWWFHRCHLWRVRRPGRRLSPRLKSRRLGRNRSKLRRRELAADEILRPD